MTRVIKFGDLRSGNFSCVKCGGSIHAKVLRRFYNKPDCQLCFDDFSDITDDNFFR